MMKIVILCSDDSHNKYLVRLLRKRLPVAAVVIERSTALRRRALRRRKYKTYLFAQYHRWRRRLLGLSAYRARFFGDESGPNPIADDTTHCVDSINATKVVQLLRRIEPDVTVVMGTSIIRSRVLAAAGDMILNIHGGCLPYYRGNHCFFKALYDGRPDRAASTIHFIDRGVDTGDIVERIYPRIAADDNAESLYCKAEKMAIHRLVYWLRRYERVGELPRVRQSMDEAQTIRTQDRTLQHDITYWIRRRIGELKLKRQAPRYEHKNPKKEDQIAVVDDG